jgi:hypothetical protein
MKGGSSSEATDDQVVNKGRNDDNRQVQWHENPRD